MIEPLSILAALLLGMQAQAAAPETQTTKVDVATAPADGSEAEEVEDTESVEDEDDKIICRRTAVIGSKFKKKMCGTAKQWRTMAAQGRDTAKEFQRLGKGVTPSN